MTKTRGHAFRIDALLWCVFALACVEHVAFELVFLTFRIVAGRQAGGQYVCLFVCLFVCLSVCLLGR